MSQIIEDSKKIIPEWKKNLIIQKEMKKISINQQNVSWRELEFRSFGTLINRDDIFCFHCIYLGLQLEHQSYAGDTGAHEAQHFHQEGLGDSHVNEQAVQINDNLNLGDYEEGNKNKKE